MFINQKEIVEISAYFFCGQHVGINIKLSTLRESGENTGKHTRLYPRGDIQFGADTFFLGVFHRALLNRCFKIDGHLVECRSQYSKLII